jgi:hypothetical protein
VLVLVTPEMVTPEALKSMKNLLVETGLVCDHVVDGLVDVAD